MKKFLPLLLIFLTFGIFCPALASEKEEKHFTAQEIVDENNKFTETPDFYKSNSFMDEHKIDMQFLCS